MTIRQIMIEIQVYTALILQLVIAVTMYSRRLHARAKFFFAYILWQTLSTAIIYLLLHFGPPEYVFYTSWVNNFITMSLGLAIIIELFQRFFEPYTSIRRFARILFLWSALAFVAIGLLVATFRQVNLVLPIVKIFFIMERSVRIIQLGLILVLLGLSKYLHLRWKNYLFGIALGFGFYALMALTGLTVLMYYGHLVGVFVDTLLGTAYCGAVVVWTCYILQPDAVSVPIVSLPSHELERWDQALSQLLGRKPSSSISAAGD